MNSTKRIAILLTLLALSIVASCAVHAQGFNVQHNGAPQFCTQNLQVTGSIYNFRDDCNQPPPNGDWVDPLSLTFAQVIYSAHGTNPADYIANNVNVRDFASVYGRSVARDPIQQYPFSLGSTISLVVGRGQHFSPALTIPASLIGSNFHILKGTAYGSGPPPQGTEEADHKPIDLVTYDSNGQPLMWPGCSKTNVYMDNTPLIYYIAGTTTNRSYCGVPPGSRVLPVAAWHNPLDSGRMMFTWN